MERFLPSNIDLEAVKQIDMTWVKIEINLSHADILRSTFKMSINLL